MSFGVDIGWTWFLRLVVDTPDLSLSSHGFRSVASMVGLDIWRFKGMVCGDWGLDIAIPRSNERLYARL